LSGFLDKSEAKHLYEWMLKEEVVYANPNEDIDDFFKATDEN
jgi:hypothetical protein